MNTIFGINSWTFGGIILVLLGSYFIHLGSKKTTMNLLKDTSDGLKESFNTSIDSAAEKITNPKQKLDDFLTTVYKQDFDQFRIANNNYAMFLDAINRINDGSFEGNIPKKKSDVNLAVKGMEMEMRKVNNEITEKRDKLEQHFNTISLLETRISDKGILQMINEHKLFVMNSKQSYNGTDGKQKSIPDSQKQIKEAEIRLVSAIYLLGLNK